MTVFDDRVCELGEGPFWHPLRGQLFWFDILGRRLMCRGAEGAREWVFPEMVSAAGVIDRDELLVASETALFRFNLETGARRDVVGLEADDPATRSNDGRADPMGGFWIGTMGKVEGPDEPKRGSIYRFFKGELRRLYTGFGVTNSISFSPDGRVACFSDTPSHRVMRVALDPDGWPAGEPEVFLDFTEEMLLPDGAVMDAEGVLWLAFWEGARVAAYGPDGRFLKAVPFPAPHTTCPAFGGADLTTLFCTSARVGLSEAERPSWPQGGMTFAAEGVAKGQPVPLVRL
ncbi:SMP-30/gluconolactonase/LRE family protein [Neotabrizicola shimadae]|uniref:SMP-30/gluconolactonase/LRE family protein n=1 Tax=Neotabrizicola shimadae TaxID=2807096 RepID=A0A8G0ZUV4_9RHOB|nr:SMP-30/gluconolactonase/LRE family protein [Neotabrizicola shimadae]QYZ69060.1 SMP-30/gluconolactonase/LRE family protein [Neotabrizicola shimadae]